MKTEDWSGMSANQGTPKIVGSPQKRKRGREGSPYRFQIEHDPEDTMISDLQYPEL